MEKRSLHARLYRQHKAPPASLHPKLRGWVIFLSPVPWDQPHIPVGTPPARPGTPQPVGAAPCLLLLPQHLQGSREGFSIWPAK